MTEGTECRLVVSEFLTVDGVFDAATMEDWMFPYRGDDLGDHILAELQDATAMLLGRLTFEEMAAHWPHQKDDPSGVADRMNALPKYVVASSQPELPWAGTTVLSGNASEAVRALKRQHSGEILLGGSSQLACSLQREGLVDEYRFIVFPIVFGHGKRFFTEGEHPAPLELLDTKTFSTGATFLRYAPR